MSSINNADIQVRPAGNSSRDRPSRPAKYADHKRSSEPTDKQLRSAVTSNSSIPRSSKTSLENKVHEAIIDLYLQVKIRSNDEVSPRRLTTPRSTCSSKTNSPRSATA